MTESPFKKVITGDDSITCFHAETGELYHNKAGAYTEALKNYIEPSSQEQLLRKNGTLDVLDVCFGLGYNTFVLLAELQKQEIPGQVNVLALDIDEAILSVLPDVLNDQRFTQLKKFMGPHVFQPKFGTYEFALNETSSIKAKLEIRQSDAREEALQLRHDFDLIFHDGFSPYKVPELWTSDLFARYYNLLTKKNGALLTYSAAAAVRNGLKLAGFEVYATYALGNKAGGTLATTSKTRIVNPGVKPLTRDEESKLLTKSGIPYRDNGLAHTRKEILAARAQEQSRF